ncbi:hypothetical protein [Nannocystis sp.]|uniref:hypothetical protein n=1 Tax=Nannocystis sp. TaxID=1962667 RepID=UPI0025DFE540|nr:hypothetical protein [Nannocystis sp.]MBK7828893.1 hypothetical protein [Nannocystis sp.]
MVEVDVFWAYAIGGSCAAAAGRPLASASAPLDTPHFTRTLLLLALVWAPTGLLLLLRHPSWETMQVADNFAAIPPWLTLGFGLTNVTQGIVGFLVGARLLAHGRSYAAHISWLLGYFAMFFVLLYGWDGRGYDRFLYDRDMFGGVAWTPGAGLQPRAGVHFLTSSVARTLYLDGVYLLPPLLYLIGRWHREDARRSNNPQAARSIVDWAGLHLGLIFGVALGAAGFTALVTHQLFTVTGDHLIAITIAVPLSLTVLWQGLLAPGRPLQRRLARTLGL